MISRIKALIRLNELYWRIGIDIMQTPRVLIVEHDDRICRVLGRIFHRMGYDPNAAADYESFKSLYNEQTPAVILLNQETIGNDNAGYCRYLVERNSPAAIILLSDMEEDESTDLLKLGSTAGLNMLGVLRKPVDVESVKALLGRNIPTQLSQSLKKSLQIGPSVRICTQTGKVSLYAKLCNTRPISFMVTKTQKPYNWITELKPSIQGVSL